MSFLIERYFQILENHAIYGKINSAETLSFFAERHVIAVWSYNALLRSLQKDLVASSLPINSEPQKIAIRLITEMVLNEEVDDLGDGSFQSHMELYLEAMRDLNCDLYPVFAFFDLLQQEKTRDDMFAVAGFSAEVKKYARQTLRILRLPLHVRAAALFYEGEPYIPDKFLFQLWNLREKVPVERLVEYFERHIEGLKRQEYSASGRLVEILCAFDPQLNWEAEKIAERSMKRRIELWNTIESGLDNIAPSSAICSSHGRHLSLVR